VLVGARARQLLDAREMAEGEIEILVLEDELGPGVARDTRPGSGGQRLGHPAVLDREFPGDADGGCGHARAR
jgi:hypothetical protein